MELGAARAVAVGAVAGAGLRWGLGEWVDGASTWPWAVFIANVAGCLLLGLLVGGFRSLLHTDALIGWAIGFCGSLTTFSAFALDLAHFLRDDRWGWFAAYLSVSVVLGLVAFVGGRAAGRELRIQGRLP